MPPTRRRRPIVSRHAIASKAHGLAHIRDVKQSAQSGTNSAGHSRMRDQARLNCGCAGSIWPIGGNSMKKRVTIHLLLLAMISVAAVVAAAQGTTVKSGNVSKSATITAINQTTRVVTLKDAQGNVEDFH